MDELLTILREQAEITGDWETYASALEQLLKGNFEGKIVTSGYWAPSGIQKMALIVYLVGNCSEDSAPTDSSKHHDDSTYIFHPNKPPLSFS